MISVQKEDRVTTKDKAENMERVGEEDYEDSHIFEFLRKKKNKRENVGKRRTK